jgi:predicted dehydrogenase
MDNLKLCSIGCGGIAVGYHGPALRRYVSTHSGVELAACCDVDVSKAEDFCRLYNYSYAYTKYTTMLDEVHPNAICLAVPPPVTCKLGCDILQRGIPLLLEKPPGLTTLEVDRLIAAADSNHTPNQVAFNRRYTPLMRRLKELLASFCPAGFQHLRYDFTRVSRTDPDFSTTAIHGIDTARFIADADYAHVQFRYQEFPELGPTVANIFMDGSFTSGATFHLAFCPVSGSVTERASVYALDHSFYLQLPIWNGFDAPGRLQHIYKGNLLSEETGPQLSGSSEDFILNGFYAENAEFLDAIRAGQRPTGDVRSARQSVEIAQCIRERRAEYDSHAS